MKPTCKLCPIPGTYATASFPLDNRTRTHFRLAEFGFLGFFINVFKTTPFNIGLPSRGFLGGRNFLCGPSLWIFTNCNQSRWARENSFFDFVLTCINVPSLKRFVFRYCKYTYFQGFMNNYAIGSYFVIFIVETREEFAANSGNRGHLGNVWMDFVFTICLE